MRYSAEGLGGQVQGCLLNPIDDEKLGKVFEQRSDILNLGSERVTGQQSEQCKSLEKKKVNL